MEAGGLDDVRGVCSPADANPGQPVPTRVTAADRRSQTGVRVLELWSWAGRTAVRGTWVNVGHSLPPQVNPQVARLGPRALVAQGIEQRFPKTTLRCVYRLMTCGFSSYPLRAGRFAGSLRSLAEDQPERCRSCGCR